jgi:hypothetical protein
MVQAIIENHHMIETIYCKQTCQVSQFNHETHNFLCFLTIIRLSPQNHKWFQTPMEKEICYYFVRLDTGSYWNHKEKTAYF